MAAKVTISRSVSGDVNEEATHAEPTALFVKDGHLHLTKWDRGADRTVAVYAPGHWTDATIEA